MGHFPWLCWFTRGYKPLKVPIGSMYGIYIYANIWGILMVNVTIYSSTMDPMGYHNILWKNRKPPYGSPSWPFFTSCAMGFISSFTATWSSGQWWAPRRMLGKCWENAGKMLGKWEWTCLFYHPTIRIEEYWSCGFFTSHNPNHQK